MILYLDCSSGVSGDMLVAALLSLAGASEADPGPLDDVLRPALAAAGIDPRLVQIEDVRRGGIAALAFKVADQPGFATFDELIMSLYASDLEQPVADTVASIAERMAAAEAEVHGRDDDHLHELSDVDTAVDLICAATLLDKLAPEQVVASPPALGDGEIETAHGRLSVPAPAVLSLVAGLPTAGGAPAVPAGETPAAPLGELTTPTGAALLAHFAAAFGGLPSGRVERVGYGAGRREVPGRPNVLRAVLVDPAAAPDVDGEALAAAAEGGHGAAGHVMLEASIDDMTPELLAHAAEALREAGRYIVKPFCRCHVLLGIARHDTADDEIDDDPPHLVEELGDGHDLARLVGLLHDRMLAVGFHRRPGRRPHKVRPANPGIPEVAQSLSDVRPHLLQDLVVPTGTGGVSPFLADEPNGGSKSGR